MGVERVPHLSFFIHRLSDLWDHKLCEEIINMATMIRLDFPVLLNLVEPVPYRVFIIPDAYTFVKIYSQLDSEKFLLIVECLNYPNPTITAILILVKQNS